MRWIYLLGLVRSGELSRAAAGASNESISQPTLALTLEEDLRRRWRERRRVVWESAVVRGATGCPTAGTHALRCLVVPRTPPATMAAIPVAASTDRGLAPRERASSTRAPARVRRVIAAAGNTCPATRPAGSVSSACVRDAGGNTFGCSSDVDCQSGQNGRCFDGRGGVPCPGNVCSYDGMRERQRLREQPPLRVPGRRGL